MPTVYLGTVQSLNASKHQKHCLNVLCKSWLQETEKQFQVRRSAQIRQQLFNKPRHGVIYPEDAYVHTWHRKLDLTPSTARELVLLADLVGWVVFVPILLDMASRPDDCSFMNCDYSLRQSRDLDRVWGGFEALKILTSECEMLHHALTMFVPFYSCTIGLAEKAHGPSSQPLVQILPAMAVAVAQGAFTKGSKLFEARKEHVYDTNLHVVRQHFIKDIAYIISDLAVLVTEEGKSGGRVDCTSHAKHLYCIVCSTQSLLGVVCVNAGRCAHSQAHYVA